jgi:anti-sigma B factor antagonist
MSESPPSHSVPIETQGEAIVARPQAKMLDDVALKALSQAVDDAASASSGVSLVVIDLSRVQIIPSLGLGLLVQMSSKCKSRQQKLKLAGVQPSVRQVFAITRLDRVFDFAPNVEAALA